MFHLLTQYFSLSLLLIFLACSGSQGTQPETLGETVGGQGAKVPSTGTAPVFKASDFSPYVHLSPDQQWLRMDFSFFPDGTDFDFAQQSIAIPCTFAAKIPEGMVDVELSAPIEKICDNPFNFQFTADGEKFTINGIVVPLKESYDKFAQDFGFEITPDGVKDILDQKKISSEDGKLESFYQAVLQKM